MHGSRASDDIEGDLGLRLDACVSGAISQCWGGSPVQSGDHARRAQPTSHDSQFAQPRESDAAAARMGIHRPRQDPVSVTGQHDTAYGAPSPCSLMQGLGSIPCRHLMTS